MELMWHCPMLDVTRPYANIFHMPAKRLANALGTQEIYYRFSVITWQLCATPLCLSFPKTRGHPLEHGSPAPKPADLLGLVESVKRTSHDQNRVQLCTQNDCIGAWRWHMIQWTGHKSNNPVFCALVYQHLAPYTLPHVSNLGASI